jgi:predicted enzyme related to lactoylglutathione lyase
MRVKMVSLHVNEPAAAHEFYTTRLGFTDIMVRPEANLYIVASPDDPGGVGLLLEPSDSPVAAAYKDGIYAAGQPAIVFGVSDVAAEYERLTAAGVRFSVAPTTDPSGTFAILDDGCGNYVQLHQDS